MFFRIKRAHPVQTRRMSPTRQALRRFFRQPLGTVALVVLAAEIFVAVLAPFIAPGSPTEQHLSEKLRPPSWDHVMGTDNLGRDVFSRVVYGTRNTLGGSLLALLILTTMGVIIGGVAGFAGGITDLILMRITDALLSFPYLVLALGLAAAFSPSLLTVVIAVALTWWGHYARVIRGMVLGIRETVYVEASRAVGAGSSRILAKHVLPNVMAPILVLSTLDLGLIVLAVAALSYLGLGVQPPAPEWGMMLNESRLYMFLAPHIMIYPGLAIFITVLAANILGDALRDAFDPKQRIRRTV
jgi:ABC-type dipeptide/oligopeptide/nickel transport system permease subunit